MRGLKKILMGIIAGLSLVGVFGLTMSIGKMSADTKTVSVPYLFKHKKISFKIRMDKQDHRYRQQKHLHPFSVKITNRSNYGTRFYFTQVYNTVVYNTNTYDMGTFGGRVKGPHKSVYVKAHQTVTVHKAYYLNHRAYARYFNDNSGGFVHYNQELDNTKLLLFIDGNSPKRKTITKRFHQHKYFYAYN